MKQSVDIKHKHYQESYQSSDVFWGLGIENETYFVVDCGIVSGDIVKSKRARERYSVDYYLSYDKKTLDKALDKLKKHKNYPIPNIINAHYLKNCDNKGEHKTTYAKTPLPNPKYSGTSNIDHALSSSSRLSKVFGKGIVFDGDSIEFITNKFYKTTVDDCINELFHVRGLALKTMFPASHAPISLQTHNYGFATHLTNPRNVVTCNNGTYHINVTLPTKLSGMCNVLVEEEFISNHKRFARLVQWIEPLLVACYGSGDIFNLLKKGKYAAGSQRVALSRYISIGTYNTEKMEPGKKLDDCNPPLWYRKLHKHSGYNPQESVGYDINFRKHPNHGLEFRFFDFFPPEYLQGVMETLIYIGDYSLDELTSRVGVIPDPRGSLNYHKACKRAVMYGHKFTCSDYFKELSSVFRISSLNGLSAHLSLEKIATELWMCYKTCGYFSSYAIGDRNHPPIVTNYNKIHNKLHKSQLSF